MFLSFQLFPPLSYSAQRSRPPLPGNGFRSSRNKFDYQHRRKSTAALSGRREISKNVFISRDATPCKNPPVHSGENEPSPTGGRYVRYERPRSSIRQDDGRKMFKRVPTGCCKNDERFPSAAGRGTPVGGLLVYLNWKILHALASEPWNASENIIVGYFKHVL